MSSHPPSDAPSAAPDGGSVGELTAARGEALLDSLERRDPGSRRHADATASYAFATAVELGLDREPCLLIREAARLHEIGKLYVRAQLLARAETDLSPRARRELDAHTVAGHRLALGAGVPTPACELILHSGDRYDADADSDAREGDEIPIGSRIIAAACEYDRQLARHTGRGRRGRPWALIAVAERSGAGLDPTVVDALARVAGRAERTVVE